MEFKKLGAVELVDEFAQSANVLIEEGGVVKKAPKSMIGAQRELVYEWNFEADENRDNCVYEVVENVEDDLSWMFNVDSNVSFEIQAFFYGEVRDENGEDIIVDQNIEVMLYCNRETMGTTILRSDLDSLIACYISGYEWMPSHDTAYSPSSYIYIFNKKHIGNDQSYYDVENGGAFEIDADWPLKAVKIYKVIR